MESPTLYIEQPRVPVVSCIALFLLFSSFSQLFLTSAPAFALAAFVLSLVVIIVVLLVGTRQELFLFLYFITAMSITIPFIERREYDLVLPTLFFVIAVFRFFPKFLHIKKQYLHPILMSVFLFLIFCIIGVLNNIRIPGINAVEGENSGLLNRFNLLNSAITFLTALILFDYRFVEKWIDYLFKFYVIILSISLVIILLELKPFPLFNSFTWSLLTENEQSKKMIIAGLASSVILIYTMVFIKSNSLRFYPLVLFSLAGLILSGNRTFFFIGVFILFFSVVVEKKVFGKSMILLAAGMICALYLLLTPLVLLVPEKFQRLVIIFPPEYYTGKLAPLSESAAASSSNFRVEIWGMAITKIKERPFTGNSFQPPQANYDFAANPMQGFQQIPEEILHADFLRTGSLHNTFFSIAYLLGIPALLLFVYFFIRLIWRHYRYSLVLQGEKRRVSIFIVIMLIQYFLSAVAGDIIFDLQFFLFLAVAIKVMLFYYHDRASSSTYTST